MFTLHLNASYLEFHDPDLLSMNSPNCRTIPSLLCHSQLNSLQQGLAQPPCAHVNLACRANQPQNHGQRVKITLRKNVRFQPEKRRTFVVSVLEVCESSHQQTSFLGSS